MHGGCGLVEAKATELGWKNLLVDVVPISNTEQTEGG